MSKSSMAMELVFKWILGITFKTNGLSIGYFKNICPSSGFSIGCVGYSSKQMDVQCDFFSPILFK